MDDIDDKNPRGGWCGCVHLASIAYAYGLVFPRLPVCAAGAPGEESQMMPLPAWPPSATDPQAFGGPHVGRTEMRPLLLHHPCTSNLDSVSNAVLKMSQSWFVLTSLPSLWLTEARIARKQRALPHMKSQCPSAMASAGRLGGNERQALELAARCSQCYTDSQERAAYWRCCTLDLIPHYLKLHMQGTHHDEEW